MWKFKTGGISPEEFRDCENSMEFFKNIRDGEIDLKKKMEFGLVPSKIVHYTILEYFMMYDKKLSSSMIIIL